MTHTVTFAVPPAYFTTLPSSTRLREAYEKHLPAMLALPAEQLSPIIIDIPQAVTTALGALPELRALRPRIVDELPRFDVERFDSIEGFTLAAAHAHAIYMAAAAPPEDLTQLNDQASQLRETLLTDAAALVRRGLIDARRLSDFKGLTGYRNVAFELLGVATLLRSSWQSIASKTALTTAELDVAEGLADRILNGVGLREQNAKLIAEASGRRQRAFTLFVRAYDQARRAVAFLRWDEGDVDRIAPSLYAGRGGRKKTDDKTDEKTSPGPDAPGQPQAPSPASPASPAHPADPGLPTGDPFIK